MTGIVLNARGKAFLLRRPISFFNALQEMGMNILATGFDANSHPRSKQWQRAGPHIY
jgi:hypothetical protein